MKKTFTLFCLLLIATAGVKAQTTTWDFTANNPSWTSGTIGGTDPVVDYVDPKGLGLHGIATNTNFAAWNSSSASSWSAPNDVYTAGTVRVQTNGAGFAGTGVEATPTQRYFFIEVNQACTVKVWFKSGSGNAIRSVIASDGTTEYGKAASVGNVTVPPGYPTDGGFLSASITKAGTFFLYGDAAVNIYQIQVVGATVSLTPTNTVPVKFSSISANYSSGVVKVAWTNETELNTATYEIERSVDGRTFSSIGSVSATNVRGYSWYDNAPLSGKSYYRIKGVDHNGTLSYSSIASTNDNSSDIIASPNPVKGGALKLKANNISTGKYTVTILGSGGQTVYSTSVDYTGGAYLKTISLPASVTTGLYNVIVTNGAAKFSHTVIVE